MPLKAQDMQVDGKSLAQQAYEAYGAAPAAPWDTGPWPPWRDLPETTQGAWTAVVNRILELTAGFNPEEDR
jgi:hypothetical protein